MFFRILEFGSKMKFLLVVLSPVCGFFFFLKQILSALEDIFMMVFNRKLELVEQF